MNFFLGLGLDRSQLKDRQANGITLRINFDQKRNACRFSSCYCLTDTFTVAIIYGIPKFSLLGGTKKH